MCRFSLISKENVDTNGLNNYLSNFSNIGINVEANMPLNGGYYQLGWSSYCFFTQQHDGFKLDQAEKLQCSRFDIPANAVSRIVTRSVSGCTVVVIKIGNELCFMHLDKSPAAYETQKLTITNNFLEDIDASAKHEIFIVFSYIETETGAGINLANAVERHIRQRFTASDIRVFRIRRCTAAQHRNGENITCHVEIGTAFDGGEVIVYGDVYKALTGEFVDYFEVPLTANGFIDGETLYNRDSEGGCCIVM